MDSLKRQYIPGYTGYIPQKINTYSMSVGKTQQVLATSTANQILSYGEQPTSQYYSDKDALLINKEADSIKYTMQSKKGVNWIGGATYEVYPEHIPGYQGHVPGLVSDNLHGKPYTNLTKKAICGELNNDFDMPPEKKYVTQYNKSFNQNSLPKATTEQDVPRDKNNFEQFRSTLLENDFTVKNILSDIPTVGYQGFKSLYRNKPSNIKPVENVGYLGASKTILTASKSSFTKAADEGKQVVVPVTGYTGFRPAVKAQNFYGKSFRDTSMASKITTEAK